VLTNGEHEGRRGVNRLVEAAVGGPAVAREQGFYLPGLAAGGVEIQDRHGKVAHPGVTPQELDFLAALPQRARSFLAHTLTAAPANLPAAGLDALLDASVLDNALSPTLNLNHVHHRLRERPQAYAAVQRAVAEFLDEQLAAAAQAGLAQRFFIHYAPNLGRGADGRERLKPGDAGGAGTHDFQFMLSGAVKEAGVLVLLNHHIRRRSGHAPLGEDFNVRTAPRELDALLELARDRFAGQRLPRLIGVGDTVSAQPRAGDGEVQRGGSDRGFLTLVQALGRAFGTDNAVIYVDSSGGEVRRPGVDAALLQRRLTNPALPPWEALRGISDAADPLRPNFVCADGHRQYQAFFGELARRIAG
jgi:glucosylglycerol 3-phosphatase